MLTKENVIKTVSKLPDSFGLNELIDKLLFIEKVQKGFDESRRIKFLPGKKRQIGFPNG